MPVRIKLAVAAIFAALAVAVAAQTSSAAPPTCSFKIAYQYKAGVCEADGVLQHFATLYHALTLGTLTLKFFRYRTASRLTSHNRSVAARGVFLILSFSLTNKSNVPQTYKDSQAELAIGSDIYTESASAEDGPDDQSLMFEDVARPLQPGKSETGDMIFDVPPSSLTTFKKALAILAVGNYGASLKAGAIPAESGLFYF